MIRIWGKEKVQKQKWCGSDFNLNSRFCYESICILIKESPCTDENAHTQCAVIIESLVIASSSLHEYPEGRLLSAGVTKWLPGGGAPCLGTKSTCFNSGTYSSLRVPSFRPLSNADLPRLTRFREQFGRLRGGWHPHSTQSHDGRGVRVGECYRGDKARENMEYFERKGSL